MTNEQKLEKEKLHPRYKHYRFADRSAITECIIETKDKMPISKGYSICSHRDNFCRVTGRERALGRAVAAMENEKSTLKLQCRKKFTNDAITAFTQNDKYLSQYVSECDSCSERGCQERKPGQG